MEKHEPSLLFHPDLVLTGAQALADLGEASNTEGCGSCHHTCSIQTPWALGHELASEKQGPGWLTLVFYCSAKDFWT